MPYALGMECTDIQIVITWWILTNTQLTDICNLSDSKTVTINITGGIPLKWNPPQQHAPAVGNESVTTWNNHHMLVGSKLCVTLCILVLDCKRVWSVLKQDELRKLYVVICNVKKNYDLWINFLCKFSCIGSIDSI